MSQMYCELHDSSYFVANCRGTCTKKTTEKQLRLFKVKIYTYGKPMMETTPSELGLPEVESMECSVPLHLKSFLFNFKHVGHS